MINVLREKGYRSRDLNNKTSSHPVCAQEEPSGTEPELWLLLSASRCCHFATSFIIWEAGQIGLQGPFLFAHSAAYSGPLHCSVQLALMVGSVRREGERGQTSGIRLHALLGAGPSAVLLEVI